MRTSPISIHALEPADVNLTEVYGEMPQRELQIGTIHLLVGSVYGAASLREQSAALIRLANAAVEMAHWAEDIAGDKEHAAPVAS